MADPRRVAGDGWREPEAVANKHHRVAQRHQDALRKLRDFRASQITNELFFGIKVDEEHFKLCARSEGGGISTLVVAQERKPEGHSTSKKGTGHGKNTNNKALFMAKKGERALMALDTDRS